ncbi:MAG: hypothetical protein QG645_707 [Patescibacteria group bacterium]|nr:hypothetical protein [Patescibacteria group bacterium]
MAQEQKPIQSKQESFTSGELEKLSVEAAHNSLKQKEKASNAHESGPINKEQLQSVIDKEAKTSESYKKQAEANNHDTSPHKHYLTHKIKTAVFHQTMDDVRSHLSPSEQRFSKIIHNDTIESLSNLGGKTVARPIGILGGATILVIGSFIVLFFAKRYGFEVPLSLFAALYVIGFVLMKIAEYLYRIVLNIFHKKQQNI